MNQRRFFTVLMIVLSEVTCTGILAASKGSLVEKINQQVPGKGSVTIIQDDKITERLGKPGKRSLGASDAVFTEVSGYRIQVFVGNNQRESKNEAYSKETDVKSIFPEMTTYVGFTAPFWRLKVGDFQSYQEAQKMLLQLRSKFPEYGREMSVVKDRIRIKKSN